MALGVTTVQDNAFQPGILAETYIPDQLIAGGLKLVTMPVTITGGANLLRGTVMGRVTAGTITSSTGTAQATGTITVAALPVVGDTLTIQGTAITFVAFPSGAGGGGTPSPFVDVPAQGNNVYIQSTVALQAVALANFLVGSTDVNLVKMTYAVAGAVVTATAVAFGVAGNAYTLATSDATAFTLSGGTLSGGVANTSTTTIGSITAGPNIKAGSYKAVTTATVTVANVFDPSGLQIGQVTTGVAFKNPEINFTLTLGGTATAGDTFIITSAVAGGNVGFYKQAIASSVDGSEVPVAILVDAAAAAAGNVASGVYVMGEFNADAIIYDPSFSLAQLVAALIPIGIFIKTSVSAGDPVGE
jgi:hypothetical protein